RAGDRTGAERHAVGRLARRLEALLVARERFDVRHPPVAEQHRLRGLEVRVRGDRDRPRGARLADERALELAQALDRLPALPHDAHAEERRDLVVATATGVEAPPRIAAAGDQLRLDRGVDVFTLQLHRA